MKAIMFFTLASFAVLAFNSCEDRDGDNENCVAVTDPACFCTAVYDPVCGCDEVTYSNPCMAECASIYNYTPGPCPQ